MDNFQPRCEPADPPQLPGYGVERLLGQGSSASTWLVRPDGGGAALAAKCFPPPAAVHGDAGMDTPTETDPSAVEEHAASGRDVAGWERELRILSRYRHEHLLGVYGIAALAGPRAGGRALLMEWAAGGSLRAVVAARGVLGVGECVTILTPLAQVLGYLHGEGVWHGDVSPGNVLFTAHGKPVLADFGLGRLMGETGAAVLGTAGFAPASDARMSAAADVRAAAAVGWFALTGQRPAADLERPPLSVLVPDVPAELAAALEAALHDEPSQRPTALELAQAVYRSAPAEPVDLAMAVHPSVVPELLTRRPAASINRTWAARAVPWWPRVRRGVSDWFRHRHGNPQSWHRTPWQDPHSRVRSGDGAGPTASTEGSGIRRPGPVLARNSPAVQRAAPLPASRREALNAERVQGPGQVAVGHRAGAVDAGRRRRATAPRGIAAGARAVPVPAPERPRDRRARQRHGLRWWRPVAAGAVLLLSLGAGSLMWRAGSPADAREPAAQSTRAQPADPWAGVELPGKVKDQLAAADPATALSGLSWLRSYALGSRQAKLLDLVNAPGSLALAADAAVADALAASGHSFSGLESTVGQSAPAADAGPSTGGKDTHAVLDAVVETAPFLELDAQARVVARHPGASGQHLRFVLVRKDGRWQISEVLDVGA